MKIKKNSLTRLVFYSLLVVFGLLFFILSQRWIEKVELETAEIYRKLEEIERKKDLAFLEVYFFDIKGAAILINYSNEHQILVDSGFSKNKLLRRVKQFMPEGDKKIETMILTHRHQDHYVGFPAVLSEYKTDFFISNYSSLSKAADLIKSQEAKTAVFWNGDVLKIDELLRLNFISPNKEKSDLYPDENDRSLVFRLVFGENSFLFMGDARIFAEEELLERKVNLKADFLKVGYHGYPAASSEQFLEKVLPEKAIITNGHKLYSEEVFERLKNKGAEVFLASSSIGQSVVVKCFYRNENCEIRVEKNLEEGEKE